MRTVLVMMMALAMSVLMVLPASAAGSEKSGAQNFDTGLVERGFGTLERYEDGVELGVHLRDLTPGNAITVWAVIFNTPEGCTDPCDENDVGEPAAGSAVIWAGVGGVVNGGGNLNGHATIGETADGAPGQILFGSLDDAEGAEIHFVVQDHGAASDDPATLLAQTTTFLGGCPPNACDDIQFIAFK